MSDPQPDSQARARAIDPWQPSSARVYDYTLGGKDNFAADRHIAEESRSALPTLAQAARENRKFMRRAVRFLLDAGIRQFIDIGCGLPGRGNVHEVVHAADPAAKVVYVDNDLVAVRHFQALVHSLPATIALHADARWPCEVLGNREVTGLIDFSRPVGILMISLLHHIADRDHPHRIVAEFAEALAPGGYLALDHLTGEHLTAEDRAVTEKLIARSGITVQLRDRDQVGAFFTGLDLVEPGLVAAPEWRPDRPYRPPSGWVLAGVGRRP